MNEKYAAQAQAIVDWLNSGSPIYDEDMLKTFAAALFQAYADGGTEMRERGNFFEAQLAKEEEAFRQVQFKLNDTAQALQDTRALLRSIKNWMNSPVRAGENKRTRDELWIQRQIGAALEDK